jgi:holo-[acyl-carrier protein] synthase
MILGLGMDVVEVSNMGKRLQRSPALMWVFSEGERAYADARPRNRTAILAARWAAKEAFAKAVGTGIRAEWPLNEIEVVNDASGRPQLRLGEHFVRLLPPSTRVHLSLTHTHEYAAATVIIEQT